MDCAKGAAAGGTCKAGALAGGASAFATPMFGPLTNGQEYVAAALVGGIASKLGGGRFENGAITGAFGYLLNDLNLFDDNDPLKRQAARLINDQFNSDGLNSYGHGNYGYVANPRATGGLSVEEHAMLLRKDEKWSDASPPVVRLWQCLCGGDSQTRGNYAQKLANELGTTVIASEKYVRYPANGTPKVYWDGLADYTIFGRPLGIYIEKPSAWITYRPQYYSNEGRPR